MTTRGRRAVDGRDTSAGEPHGAYPGRDIRRAASARMRETGARIVGVRPRTPADDAGFEPGCIICTVDGQPLRDIIDWRWIGSEECITVGYVDLDGDAGEVELWRDPGEDWGFEFDGVVFDQVRQCRNACTFCFMRQLPKGLRPSLHLRDDDYRLSFLAGTFVTLTNMRPEDEARIVEQRISPLRVSLQATSADVRARLIGKHAHVGLEALERLLAAGIEFHAQIVLVPDENDGDELVRTLTWAFARPGILNVGIVPLGYTRHQNLFDRSFNDASAARSVLDLVEPFQRRALAERGTPWVFAADEFYCNAWGSEVADHLPPASFYGDFALFEDGIGIVRSCIDDWEAACVSGLARRCADALRASGVHAHLVAGYAQRPFLEGAIDRAGMRDCMSALYVENRFFGGNVDVTGLLAGCDIASAVARAASSARGEDVRSKGGAVGEKPLFCVLRIVFNDDGLTLDDMLLEDIQASAGEPLSVVSLSPLDYLREISSLAQALV